MEQIFRLKLSQELKSNAFHLSVDLIFDLKFTRSNIGTEHSQRKQAQIFLVTFVIESTVSL